MTRTYHRDALSFSHYYPNPSASLFPRPPNPSLRVTGGHFNSKNAEVGESKQTPELLNRNPLNQPYNA